MNTLLWLTLGGSVLALFLLVLRRVFRSKMPNTVYYYAWLLVLLRFAMPIPGVLSIPTLTETPSAPAAQVERAAVENGAAHTTIVENEPPAVEAATEEQIPQATEEQIPQTTQSKTASRAEASVPETAASSQPTVSVWSRALTLVRSARFWIGVWAVGSLASLFFTAGAYSCYCFSLRQSFRRPSAEIERIYAAIPGKKPALWMCSGCKTPLMYGVFSAKIVLPATSYDEELLQNIFHHELMHYRRRDPLYKWLSVFILASQWFNPLSYLIRREMDRSCELSCDEMLLQSMTGHEKKAYGNALLSMAAVGALPHGVVATAFATEKKNLKERLLQIMNYKKSATRIVAALLAVLLLAGCGLAAGPSDSKNDKEENDNDIYYAATPEELIDAIGSDRTIVLTGTNYSLNTAEDHSSLYCVWKTVDDGKELVIRNVTNLTIKTEDGSDKACEIEVLPRFANVLQFENCGYITLSGITAGHVKQSDLCQGSVLSFDDCYDVTLNDCHLYGCGTYGVFANNVSDMLLKKTEIYECSSGAVSFLNSANIAFEDCSIHDVPESCFDLYQCENVTWNDNKLEGNATSTMDENGAPGLLWRIGEENIDPPVVPEGQYDLTAAEYQPNVDDKGVYYAANEGQLLNAIGPDRTVVLTGERYDLSELRWCDTAYCSWREVFDGEELVIGDLSNLTIRCENSEKDACLLEVLPRYANVLCFENCKNVSLYGFTAGHVKEKGECRGGVLYFEKCENMSVDSCHLFGCGTFGVITEGVKGLSVKDTEIYECSIGAVWIERTKQAEFLNCDVHDMPENPLYFVDCSDVVWNDMVLDYNNDPYGGFALDGKGNPVSRNGEWITAAEAEARRNAAAQAENLGSYEVTTVDELLAAIGPDRVITLKGESFVLSDSESSQPNGFSADYYWSEEFDGKTLVIRNLSGLTIRAETEDPHDLTIETLPRYADVLRFEDCEDLTLSGFTAGHIKEKGECTGGVLRFAGCNKITVDGCSLYGCGTWGVITQHCEELSVLNTEIYECSVGAMSLYDTSGVTVKGCNVHDMPDNGSVFMENVKHVVWEEKSIQSVESGGFNVDKDGRLK